MADLTKTDTSVHEAGATAEELGKESEVERGKSATVAASFTTRDLT